MDGRSKLVDIDCVILRESPSGQAYLIDAGNHENPVWVPKSLVEYDENDGTMAMPEWLAREKGLI